MFEIAQQKKKPKKTSHTNVKWPAGRPDDIWNFVPHFRKVPCILFSENDAASILFKMMRPPKIHFVQNDAAAKNPFCSK